MLKMFLMVFVLTMAIPAFNSADSASQANQKQAVLVGTALQTSSFSGYTIHSAQALAQEFVLDERVKATSVMFVLGGSYDIVGGTSGFGGDVTFLMQITRGIGQGSTVLVQQSLKFSALPAQYYAAAFSVPLSLQLPAGTYYLVLSTTSPSETGYLTWGPNVELTSSYGHLGLAYYANPTGFQNPNEAPFIPATIGEQTLQFQLIGK